MRTIYWFKNNLRLTDNPSFNYAIRTASEVLPVYIIDERLFRKHPLGFENLGIYRKKFLFEAVVHLQKSLRDLGSDLKILIGEPVRELSGLMESLKASKIITSKEPGYYEEGWDTALSSRFSLESIDDNSLINPTEISVFDREVPPGFTSFRKKAEELSIRPALAQINDLRPFSTKLSYEEITIPNIKEDPRSAFPFDGGEENAWNHLRNYIWKSKYIIDYKQTRNQMIGSDYSSKFSPWLAVGNLSPVSIYHEIKNFEKRELSNESTYWLYFELLWREYFRQLGFKIGKKIFGAEKAGNSEFDQKDKIGLFEKWRTGNTEDSFINANMKELSHTGFMSNRGRQNVASFLMHDLGVDWRWGAAYFESRLIDYDCASNWGNWMYIAGEINSAEPKHFDVVDQAERYDSKGSYRKLWA